MSQASRPPLGLGASSTTSAKALSLERESIWIGTRSRAPLERLRWQ